MCPAFNYITPKWMPTVENDGPSQTAKKTFIVVVFLLGAAVLILCGTILASPELQEALIREIVIHV